MRQKIHQDRLRTLTEKNEILNKTLPSYDQRVDKLELYNQTKYEEVQRSRNGLVAKQNELKTLIRKHITHLVNYIFPITYIQPKSEMTESGESDIAKALSEATHTTYIRDTWIFTDNSSEYQHSIVLPTLPGSGNYSAYNLWGKQSMISDITGYKINFV